MSNITEVLPEELVVGRGDPVYMAHGYLTKVPVPAIVPFIMAFTRPGDVVLDPFAGSGMTGVTAAALGRRSRLSDISVLGQHIGRNYVNLVDADQLRKRANEVVGSVLDLLGDIYAVPCSRCHRSAQLAKTVWTVVVECGACRTNVNYFRSLELADWHKPAMTCSSCQAGVSARQPRRGEKPVLEYVSCACQHSQHEQPPSVQPLVNIDQLPYPKVGIGADRQMYKASALGKNGNTTVASFYSPRNLAVLTVLRGEIEAIEDQSLRSKLLFVFTSCLTRASKRYQWSRQRPLNAANANYYIAPVFYEWNVIDLFLRKVEAAVRSDDWVRQQLSQRALIDTELDVTYEIRSAETLAQADASVDYVFTDPPFGSNLFYADMALFQEAWLGGFTDEAQEAVIDRGTRKARTASRYEELLTNALRECRRVLKPEGHISMVFGNSSGAVWALVQRAVAAAGLEIEPDRLVVLNKGQRSVKGLASGFEHVATLDLIITMRPTDSPPPGFRTFEPDDLMAVTTGLADDAPCATPSHLYLELLRHGMQNHWDLSQLDLKLVTTALRTHGWDIDERSGRLQRALTPSSLRHDDQQRSDSRPGWVPRRRDASTVAPPRAR